jgi:hypothetical protein
LIVELITALSLTGPVRECGGLPSWSISNITTRHVTCKYARGAIPQLEIGNKQTVVGGSVIYWRCRNRNYHRNLKTYTDHRCVDQPGIRVIRWQSLWGE